MRKRPRGRIRSRRAPNAADEKKRLSQSPARMECHDSAGHRCERCAAEACSFDHPRKCFRPGKFTDRLDEILISVSISGHKLAHARDYLERIKLIQRVDSGHVDRRQFEAQKPPADPQDPVRFIERLVYAWYVADAKGDCDAIEAAVSVG